MITYSLLREIQKKEMESAALVPVEDNFYEQLAQLLEQKKKEAQKSNSLLTIREYENIKKIVQTLQSKREEKIALVALRGEGEGHGLSHEEKILLKNLCNAIKQARGAVKGVWEKPGIVPKKVRMLKEVEKYKGIDDNVYGPFKSGQELVLPPSEVEWLLKSKMAELVL